MLTIVWDVDDVLNNLMLMWWEQSWLLYHPTCTIKYTEFNKNPPHLILGIEKEEYLNSLDDYRLSGGISQLKPEPEVLEWFKKWGSYFRHIALTATPIKTAPLMADWVIRHFGKWIRCFAFVPSYRVGNLIPEYDQDKESFLAWWKQGQIMIDDNPNHIQAAQKLGMKTFLMPQPWNNSRMTRTEILDSLTNLGRG
ncbi:hypothetical protein PQG02_19210 [Nostoc sp. UHCC 0926]|uniref:hypothetical protein n=1 Tax=unclassified Nostoc TaxID=2593658 RepID=UPI002362ABA0|nr:hypothetical protein [Nostoc sp. UHCC 0926]WDD30865.1 hypothetical protein PQG02_19210 [Nostoc sp. UHCC 0926]